MFNKNIQSQTYVSTTQDVDTKITLKNYITILIINICADEYYESTAQKWKGIILLERSDATDDCHASILVAQTNGKQDLLKSLDISIYQIPTLGNRSVCIERMFYISTCSLSFQTFEAILFTFYLCIGYVIDINIRLYRGDVRQNPIYHLFNYYLCVFKIGTENLSYVDHTLLMEHMFVVPHLPYSIPF